MVDLILSGQPATLVTTVVILILSAALAALLTKKYLKTKSRAHLYWSIGLWLFAVGVLQEVAFALNYYPEWLIDAYLLIVVVLVEFLALGSMELTKTPWLKKAFGAFVILATLYTVYTLVTSNTALVQNPYLSADSTLGPPITDYVFTGPIPLSVAVSSSIATFAAAIVLAVVALKSYIKTRNKKLLSIVVGVVVVSVAGTLWLVEYPALLYIAEFVGILLLWIGFI